jgi:hypothetical protein
MQEKSAPPCTKNDLSPVVQILGIKTEQAIFMGSMLVKGAISLQETGGCLRLISKKNMVMGDEVDCKQCKAVSLGEAIKFIQN